MSVKSRHSVSTKHSVENLNTAHTHAHEEDRVSATADPTPTSDADFVFKPLPTPKSVSSPRQRNLRSDKMSSTEKAYLRDILHGNGWFEPITLKSPSGNRYTPDFLAILDGTPTLVETKGSYRLQSEGRAHTAFLEAASNFSQFFQFLWVKRLKGGKWEQKIVIPRHPQDSPSH